MLICKQCGLEFEGTYMQRWHANKGSPANCSRHCRSVAAAVAMAKTNRRDAPTRMRERNPMRDPVVKEKMRTSLRANGWKSSGHWERGFSPTLPEMLLASALAWETGIAIPTGRLPLSVANQYRIDVGNRVLKIAVEIDGNSHRGIARRDKDKKKTEHLSSLGWKVLRFSNKEVTEKLPECVQIILGATK